MTLLLTTPGTLTEITRLREAPGAYDDTGRWQPGAVTETTLLASVQPLVLEGADLAGGVSLIERVKVYAPSVEYRRRPRRPADVGRRRTSVGVPTWCGGRPWAG